MRTRVLVGGRRQLARAGLVTSALVASAAIASAASAATLSVNAACYVVRTKQGAAITVTGSGFQPGDEVVISGSDNLDFDASPVADANGNISATTAIAPLTAAIGAKALTPVTGTLTATDFADAGTITASVPVATTFFGVDLVSKKKAPGLKAFKLKGEWTFSGFNPGQEIYGHYVIHHKQVALAKFGHAAGACGYLQVRKAGYPATPHHSSYPVQFDSSKKYSKHTSPRIATVLRLHQLF
jgi:hypothetical protein